MRQDKNNDILEHQWAERWEPVKPAQPVKPAEPAESSIRALKTHEPTKINLLLNKGKLYLKQNIVLQQNMLKTKDH